MSVNLKRLKATVSVSKVSVPKLTVPTVQGKIYYSYFGTPILSLSMPFYLIYPDKRKLLLLPILLGAALIAHDVIYYLIHQTE